MNIKKIIGRERELFSADIARYETEIADAIKGSRVLVYGGAGSIGKEITLQIFKRQPVALHVVDISENNLVELVRHIRSSLGYIEGETQFLPLNMNSVELDAFLSTQKSYDFVLNLAAMKHVRSEKDAFSLMRMIEVNILNTIKTLAAAQKISAKKYFAVSTDKAKNPANLMGATKRIMEHALFREGDTTKISTARFANVAFSDGSLLHGFRERLMLRQPISAPSDTRRYFVTGTESGLLCLASLVLAGHREVVFPVLDENSEMLTFSEIVVRFLEDNGYEPVEVKSEDEARENCAELIAQRKWPCYFFKSDTSGEKPFEEFYSSDDDVDWDRFRDIGVICSPMLQTDETVRLEKFLSTVNGLRSSGTWQRSDLVSAIRDACPELVHIDTGRFLDEKM